MTYERVYTVTDFYDGPRGGVADFEGQPHVYESVRDEAAQDFTAYRLMRISAETLALALEDWAIWTRWEAAFNAGHATIDTHPALAEDRSRYETLTRVLQERLRVDMAKALIARADFRSCALSGPNPGEVRWECI